MPLTGTLRAIVANMVHGVSEGFERKLELVGVGYRAAMQGKDLNLSLGFLASGAVSRRRKASPSRTPTQTEILVAGADKQRSVKSPPRSVASVRRSRTRARA